MEQESSSKSKTLSQLPSDQQIFQLIQTTYKSKNSAQIAAAQTTLNQLLACDKFIEKLFFYLQSQEQVNNKQADDYKLSVSLLIKKFSYQFAKKQQMQKEMFISKIFCLIISKINVKAKEQLGTALQYILNHDTEYLYKPKVIQKVTEILASSSLSHIVQGGVIISVACLNSLIEAEDQFNFLWKILDYLINHANTLLQNLKKQTVQALSFQESVGWLKLARRIFDFMELTFSRLLDQQDFIQQKINQIRQYKLLQAVFYNYLCHFGHRKSILSKIHHFNSVKQIVVQILFGLYRSKPMPQHLFNQFFITMLLQAEKQQFDDQQEHIMTRVLQLMQDYLQNKFYMQTFDDHKMQIMVAMLGYSVTKSDEIDLLEDQPERFVQMSEEFTQGFKGSIKIKVRAASFLKVFTHKFDEALRNILQILVILITAHLDSDTQNSPCIQLFNVLKQQFSQIPFFKLDPSLHIQTCFNILSLLSPYINKRQDLNKVVYAILITHMVKLQQIQQPIVLLRLIRLIGYYPTAVYYQFIKNKMSLGKVFILEGMKSFQRILKTNRYPQIFQVLAQIFSQIINIISVHDSIFQSILLNHYERVLKKNILLYKNFLIKIRDVFIQNVQKSQHISLLCLGYIYTMLNKQNQQNYKIQIINTFYSMQLYYNKVVQFYNQKIWNQQQLVGQENNIIQYKKTLKMLANYEEKITEIYGIISRKQTEISQKTIQFAEKKLKTIQNQNQNAEIFKLYNNLFLKVTNEYQGIRNFYNTFMAEIRSMFVGFLEGNINENSTKYTHKLQILPNLSYLISQIIASFDQIHLQKPDLKWMLQILPSLTEDVKQYILLIIMTYTYVQSIKIRQMLQSQNQYEYLLKILLTTSYNQRLIRKIFLLSMSKLLQIEQNYFEDIVRECIKYFREQFKESQVKKAKKQWVDPKLRRFLQDQPQQEEEQMVEEKKSKSLTSFPDFKHPLGFLSEYDQFKVKIWNNTQPIKKLNENDKNQLRQILQTDWFGKGVRKIVAIKQQL